MSNYDEMDLLFKGGNFNGSTNCYQCSLETNSHEFCAYSNAEPLLFDGE